MKTTCVAQSDRPLYRRMVSGRCPLALRSLRYLFVRSSQKNAYIMRPKCDQKRECEFLFLQHQPLTTFTGESVRISSPSTASEPSLRFVLNSPESKNVTIMSPFLSPQNSYSRVYSHLRS